MPSSSSSDGKYRQKEAAFWVALKDGRPLTPTEEQKFETWLKADTRNLGAFIQLQSLYTSLNYKTAPHSSQNNVTQPRTPSLGRRRFFVGTCAAGVAAMIQPAKMHDALTLRYRSKQAPAQYWWHKNRITVDASSSAYFSTTDTHPQIHLVSGRVGLQLHKTSMLVGAGNLLLSGKGADFDIALHGQNIVVSLYSGTLNWQNSSQKHQLHSPYRVEFSNHTLGTNNIIKSQNMPPETIITAQAWRSGQIILNDTPLQDAITEFNHYSTIQCKILNTELGFHRISGSFSLIKLDDFANAVSQLLNCKVRKTEQTIAFYT